MMQILHITPHLGGGVGQVIGAWINAAYRKECQSHYVITLEATQRPPDGILKLTPSQWGVATEWTEIDGFIQKADITVIHWWNHPLLYQFLTQHPLPDGRFVLWSHVLGAHAPYCFHDELAYIADAIVLTSEASVPYLTDELRSLYHSTIRSTRGAQRYHGGLVAKPRSNVVGTVTTTIDFSKLHPEFVNQSLRIRTEDSSFVLNLPQVDTKSPLVKSVTKYDGSKRFSLIGWLDDPIPLMRTFRVFGYPLQPLHFGTGEQVLAEAMMLAIPPVVLNNPPELCIVKHGETGLVADSIDEYPKLVEMLLEDWSMADRLGSNARESAFEMYRIETMKEKWDQLFIELLDLPKRPHAWPKRIDNKGSEIFLESIGYQKEIFLRDDPIKIKALFRSNPQWLSPSKGSVLQYLKYFPEDPHLKRWTQIAEEVTKEYLV